LSAAPAQPIRPGDEAEIRAAERVLAAALEHIG